MTGSDDTVTLDDLAAHVGFVRRLARALVSEAADADDAAQEALIAAWRRPPEKRPGLRSWFGAVVLNRLRMDARGLRRREAREAAASSIAAAVPTPEEVVARMEIGRALAGLVMKLAEPYRRVIFLRFYEDRTPAEIAALLDVPAGTVRWRLKTALDELRAALDARSDGQRSRWLRALAPLLPRRRRRAWRLPLVAAAGGAILLVAASRPSAPGPRTTARAADRAPARDQPSAGAPDARARAHTPPRVPAPSRSAPSSAG
jgi:RNA polymerase sigma-70 factor (ECF subfamily)